VYSTLDIIASLPFQFFLSCTNVRNVLTTSLAWCCLSILSELHLLPPREKQKKTYFLSILSELHLGTIEVYKLQLTTLSILSELHPSMHNGSGWWSA